MLRSVFKYSIFVVIFLAVTGLSAFLTISFFIKGEKSVLVPHLVGKDTVIALQLLSSLELNTRVQGFEYDDQVPKNHIIYQIPEAGRTIKKGRDVSLIISKGTPLVTLPDLKGRVLASARLVLEENGLKAGSIARVYSTDASRDTVISQNPPPGITVKRSDSVDLLTSLGPRPTAFEMPDLQGRFLDESLMVMDNYKLSPGDITMVYDPGKPENTVTRQDPPAGHYIEENRKVNLNVNRKSGDQNGSAGVDPLFTYNMPHGYLKQHVRLELSIYGMNVSIYDELMEPGKRIWAIVPAHTRAALFLYINDELITSKLYY